MTVTIEPYRADQHHLDDYQLSDLTYTASPSQVLKECEQDPDRYPLVILGQHKAIVGFFCLHIGAGPKLYGTFGSSYGLIRAFSIDDRYRQKGYAISSFNHMTEVLASLNLPLTHLMLAVNERNRPAQKAYAKTGFRVIKTGVPGSKGKLLLMEKILVSTRIN